MSNDMPSLSVLILNFRTKKTKDSNTIVAQTAMTMIVVSVNPPMGADMIVSGVIVLDRMSWGE